MSDLITAPVALGLRGPGLTDADLAVLDGKVAAASGAVAQAQAAVPAATAQRVKAEAAATAAAESAAETTIPSYPTYAAALAAVGGIAGQAQVLVDETRWNRRTLYVQQGGALVYRATLGEGDPKPALGAGFRAHPRNSTICIVGDSNTAKPSYFQGAMPTLTGVGGPYEGWTFYNGAEAGRRARDWVQSIAGGDQSAPPIDGPDDTVNLWRIVNADPDEVLISLGTNDIRAFVGHDGGTYADLPGAIAGITADMRDITLFLLTHTRARIILQCPPPIAWVPNSNSGFCDLTGPDDAAARSAALRSIYLGFANVSSRVLVIDLQRHLFPAGTPEAQLRWDNAAAVVDPEGSGQAIKIPDDELHFTPLGETRRAQIIARILDPTTPRSTAVLTPPAEMHQAALLSAGCVIKAVGPGYVDLYASSLLNVLGSVRVSDAFRGPLHNIPRDEDLVLGGADSQLHHVLRSTRVTIIDATGYPLTVNIQSATFTQVDGGADDWWRVSFGGTYVAPLQPGRGHVYVKEVASLPPMPADQLATTIRITGSKGAALLPLIGSQPTISAAGTNAVRQDATQPVKIGLYVANTPDGGYTGAGGSVAAPGYRLGEIAIGATGLIGNGYAGAAALPDPVTYQTCLVAVVESGAIGDWAEVVVRPR